MFDASSGTYPPPPPPLKPPLLILASQPRNTEAEDAGDESAGTPATRLPQRSLLLLRREKSLLETLKTEFQTPLVKDKKLERGSRLCPRLPLRLLLLLLLDRSAVVGRFLLLLLLLPMAAGLLALPPLRPASDPVEAGRRCLETPFVVAIVVWLRRGSGGDRG